MGSSGAGAGPSLAAAALQSVALSRFSAPRTLFSLLRPRELRVLRGEPSADLGLPQEVGGAAGAGATSRHPCILSPPPPPRELGLLGRHLARDSPRPLRGGQRQWAVETPG